MDPDDSSNVVLKLRWRHAKVGNFDGGVAALHPHLIQGYQGRKSYHKPNDRDCELLHGRSSMGWLQFAKDRMLSISREENRLVFLPATVDLNNAGQEGRIFSVERRLFQKKEPNVAGKRQQRTSES